MGSQDPAEATIDSYEHGVDDYVAASLSPSQRSRALAEFLDRFAGLVGEGRVLELGSGAGWDAEYVERRGLQVDRTDATPAFVARLRAAGHEARVLDARAEDFGGPYDAILASAVLLHLSRTQLTQALRVAHRAVRAGGVLAMTMKEGDGAEWSTAKLDRPRHFTFWPAPQLTEALKTAGWQPISVEQVPGRTDEWLFVLASARSA
ncbi:class I SAM-dependent methyltransferase [uncultured Jatrophihabitans sp.]|uniref:class I SAM-dependent methyltransferase n=1 Tax=uncultured Jatrophihabitans sp. TaxID=1610747 RepID=UPI0035CC9F14